MPTQSGLPVEGEWFKVPDFDSQSRSYKCSVSHQPRHLDDEYVIRGPMIDFEGYFDITKTCAEQLARLIGWVPAEEAASTAADVERLEAVRKTLLQENRSQLDQIRALTLQNAEGVTRETNLQNQISDLQNLIVDFEDHLTSLYADRSEAEEKAADPDPDSDPDE